MSDVERYAHLDPVTKTASGDFLRVGETDLGEFRDLVEAEYKRAGSACAMRPMWFSGSSYGEEIVALARQVRGAT